MYTHLWTYFLGASIVDERVLERVGGCENIVAALFEKERSDVDERHITLVPPFLTNCLIASQINLQCTLAQLLPNHPLVKTQFSIQHLEIMSFDGMDVLCFPVRSHSKTSEEEVVFIDYVKALRNRISGIGIQLKEKIPDEYSPHITVFIGKDIREKEEVKSLLAESKTFEPLFFRSWYPILYTKSVNGWGDLTNDPNPNGESNPL